MDKFARNFFSMRMMALGLIIFFLAIGAATFIESIYDTQTAKRFIYNANWFTILLFYLSINLLSNIWSYALIKRKQWASFIFHVSFLVIMLGAGITRWVSFEGIMRIPEKSQASFIYSADPYLWFKVNDGKTQYTDYKQVYMTPSDYWNDFDLSFQFPGHKNEVTIEYVDYQPKMVDSLVIADSIRTTAIEFVRAGRSEYVTEGDFIMWGDLAISYNKEDAMPGIELFKEGNKILMKTMTPGNALPMSVLRTMDRENPDAIADSLYKQVPMDTLIPLEKATLYNVGGTQFVFKDVIRNAKRMLMPSGSRKVGSDYLTVKITDGKESKIVNLQGGIQSIPVREVFEFKGLVYEMDYGSMVIDLPFAVGCDDFRLQRYPGSNSPTSFESDLKIVDTDRNYEKSQTIFMNHVMDYRGYRFFQSSYFPDESGTILSVNYDWWGTNITYLGYGLMMLGMIMSLFMPNARFRELINELKSANAKRKKSKGLMVIALMLSMTAFGQDANVDHSGHDHSGHDHAAHVHDSVQPATETTQGSRPERPATDPIFRVMSEEHSEQLSQLMVQDYRGRIIPMHTLCDQLLRKIHRGQKYDELNAVQTIVSMHMYIDHWADEPIIYVSSKGGLRDKLNLKGKYCSFKDLYNEQTGDFIFSKDYNKAHQTLESQRNEYQKQMLKLNEKFNIVMNIFSWQFMKIVPLETADNNAWFVPMSEDLLRADTVGTSMVFQYFNAIDDASQNDRWGNAEDMLAEFKDYQREKAGDVALSEGLIDMEIRYNKMSIFKNSAYLYLILGFILLVIFFFSVFRSGTLKSEKRFKTLTRVFMIPLIITFLYHGAGIYMRAYITGYAPWSNGYEALVFIAWAAILLGFIFVRFSAAVPAAIALFASFLLIVSEMNLMDPEITPMVPVLKSYWLMIHVAIITSSYGPLGVGCILAIVNLVMYTFRTVKNHESIDFASGQITRVIEMCLTIGVFMLTVGTFLGGIWANESWGRYWGWDPKETWALVAVLVYAVILHFRFIPGLQGKFLFNAAAMWGYASILFTFFGVNFYLVGLHSYAQGEGLGKIPNSIIITVIAFVVFTAIAAMRNRQFKKALKAHKNGK